MVMITLSHGIVENTHVRAPLGTQPTSKISIEWWVTVAPKSTFLRPGSLSKGWAPRSAASRLRAPGTGSWDPLCDLTEDLGRHRQTGISPHPTRQRERAALRCGQGRGVGESRPSQRRGSRAGPGSGGDEGSAGEKGKKGFPSGGI